MKKRPALRHIILGVSLFLILACISSTPSVTAAGAGVASGAGVAPGADTAAVALVATDDGAAPTAAPPVGPICFRAEHQNVLDENKKYLRFPKNIFEGGDPQAMADYLPQLNPFVQNTAAWIMQDVTSPSIARGAFLIQGVFARRLIGRFKPDETVVNILTHAAAVKAHYSEAAKAQARRVYAWLQRIPVVDEISRVKAGALVLCAPYFDLGCASALRDLADIMSPRPTDEFMISLIPNVRRMMLDDGLVQGAAHLGLKILARMKAGGLGLNPSQNLFDDIKESFLATGSTPAQAEDRAWTLLGMYGARGASVSFLAGFPNAENFPVFLSLYIFSSSLALLDGATLPTGMPYSYPAGTKTRCAYRTPYHFWLSAYLTHALVRKGHSARSAVLANHIMGKLYEFASETFTREPLRPYRERFFSPYSIMVRTNMAFDDAGAFYGTGEDKMRADIDEGIQKIFAASRPLPPMSPEELERGLKNPLTRYHWFHRLMAPDVWIRMKLEIPEAEETYY